MIETGVVVEIHKDQAKVAFVRKEACGSCRAGCSLMSDPGRRAVLQAHNPIHAQVGDPVRVQISPVSSVRAAVIVFLFPLLAMMVGYFAGQTLTGTQHGGIVGTGIALLLAFMGVRFLDHKLARKRGYEPVILEKLEADKDSSPGIE